MLALKDGEMALTETALGSDVEREILAHMGFTPKICPMLMTMPGGVFHPKWGGLRAALDKESRTGGLTG